MAPADSEPRFRMLILITALLGACAGTSTPRPGPATAQAATSPRAVQDGPPNALRYTFAVDEALERLQTTLCIEGRMPSELMAGTQAGAGGVTEAFVLEPGRRRPIEVRAGRISLQGLRAPACIEYTVVFAGVTPSWPGFEVLRRGRALMTNIALWLWRPPRWDQYANATARFELPVGTRLSLPWQPQGERFVLDPSAFAFVGYAVFGRFERESIDAAGVKLEVAVLDGLSARTRASVRPWLEGAVRTVALAAGRFPRERAQVVVVPFATAGEAVPFGMMTRGGGASAGFLVAADAELAELQQSWVAVHEFAHLFVPFVEREDLWLSEGFATYYQEVLRARAEIVPVSEAWRRLHDGARRGREVGRSLAADAAQVFETREFSRVYWAGAAFALLADVELRRRSQGKQTLDGLLRELAIDAQARPLSAREVLARLDQLAGEPVFAELCERWVQGPEFPDLQALYERLGIHLTAQGELAFTAGEEAWIRDAIMRAPVDSAVAPRARAVGLDAKAP